jgi:hypothetical protein
MSPEARERIAAAQRARWAKQKGGNGSAEGAAKGAAAQSKSESKVAGKQKTQGKRTMSPEARAKIAEAARRRWAKQKKGQ